MRILYLLRYYPTLTETFVYDEIDALATSGFGLITIVGLGKRADGVFLKKPPKADRILQLPKNRMGRWRMPNGPGFDWLKKHQRPKDVARLASLIELTKEHDHIHVHFAGEAAEMAYAAHLETGISFTITVHAVDLFRPRASFKTVLNAASRVATISNFNQEKLKAFHIEADLIRCGVNLNKWPEEPLPQGSIKALFVGRDTEKKGLDLLLDVWGTLDSRHTLTVIGNKKKRTATSNVRFLGHQSHEIVQKEMTKCNVFVLPCMKASNGDQDGIPVVLMEAMASGRPVISTNISGIPELITKENGWLIKSRSQTDLKKALKEAMNEQARQNKGEKARMQIKNLNCTQNKHTELMQSFFVKVV